MTAQLHHIAAPVVRHQAQWSTHRDGEPPLLAGFVASQFSPLLAAAADRCLTEHYAKPPMPPESRQSTAVLLVSASGDRVSAALVRQAVAAGRRVGPLFFFQSVPNSVAGRIASHWGLGGPVVCISPIGEPLSDGMAEAALLLADGDADEVLLLLVEQTEAASPTEHSGTDIAHALLLSKGEIE
ncbi:MAG: beta-ketoacyl synthase chain length factor [Jatrophihabitantaceae bacterium]